MFDLVKGKKTYLDPLVVCVQNPFWGMRVFITKASYETYLPQDEVSVFLHTHMVNEGIVLYGFATEIERTFFQLLTKVSGIGAKLAIRALAHLSYEEIYHAIMQNNPQFLSSLPGIGIKTAQKIILELQDKMQNLPISSHSHDAKDQIYSEAFMALESFGFESSKIRGAIKELQQQKQEWELPNLIRALLRVLNQK